MKKVYLGIMVAFLSQFSFAQSLLSGRVVDVLGQPLPFANVLVLQQADSSLISGAVANEKGEFSLMLPKSDTGSESALLEVRQIGFSTKTISFNSLKYNEFNIIQLNENINQLDEVVVRAEQPLFQQQLDKLVINVASSGLASGGTVLDVLERSPGISVDRQSGGLAMNGKQGVLVMINGKQQRMPLSMVVQQLEGLSAGQVQKVEIISNPSSRYDAEGDAGIINIVTKKPSDSGTNGTVTAGLGYSDISGYFKPFGSLMLNHQHKRMTLHTNYSYNRDNRWQQWNYERKVTGSGLQSSTVTDRYASWPIHRGSLGADWQATERTSVNMLASAFSDFWEMESFNQSEITVHGVDSAAVSLYDEEVNHWRHGMVNLNINHQPADGEKLTLDMDYLYYHDHNPNYFTNTYQLFETDTTLVEYVRTGKETPIRMGVFKLDYEKKWAQLKLEAGAKATISRLENQVKLENKVGETWEPDMRFTHDYTLWDDVQAFYLNASGNLNPKNQWQLGLRAESTDMKMDDGDETLYRLDFWKLFPTVFYSWHPHSKTSLQLSYGRRITRPAYTGIAPFVIFMDPFTYYWGNLRLKPAISDGVQATISYNDLLITLRYNQDRSAIAGQQSRYNAEEGKTYIYADNIDLLSTYSASAGWPHQLTPWWNVQASSLLLYQAISHELNDVSIEMNQFSSRWSLNQKFTLPGNLTFEVSGVYATPTRMGLTLRKSWGSVSAGLQKDIGQHSKLNFTVTDIFWTRNSVYLTDHPLLGQVQQTSYINEPRVIRLSYTLNFGTERDKTKALRTTASQTEQQRVN